MSGFPVSFKIVYACRLQIIICVYLLDKDELKMLNVIHSSPASASSGQVHCILLNREG
jgi:hypothetical protein